MRTHTLLYLALVLGAALAPASAEAQTGLAPGAKVRVRSSVFGDYKKGLRAAQIISVSTDTIVFQLDGRTDSLALRRDEVQGLERWVGRKSHAADGLKYGALGGALFGVTVGATAKYDAGEWAMLGGIVAGTLGMLGGGVLGSLSRSDRWAALSPSEWRPRISLAPASSRGVALRVAF